MEKHDFKISIVIVQVFVIGNALLTALGAIAKLQHWEFSQFLLAVGIMFFISSYVIILSDMTGNKIYNKTFWIMSMFILPSITPIFYLIRRNNLIGFEGNLVH